MARCIYIYLYVYIGLGSLGGSNAKVKLEVKVKTAHYRKVIDLVRLLPACLSIAPFFWFVSCHCSDEAMLSWLGLDCIHRDGIY